MAKTKKSEIDSQENQELLADDIPEEVVEAEATVGNYLDEPELDQVLSEETPMLLADEENAYEQTEEAEIDSEDALEGDCFPKNEISLPEEYAGELIGASETTALTNPNQSMVDEGDDTENPLPSDFELSEGDDTERFAADTNMLPDVLLDSEVQNLLGGANTSIKANVAPTTAEVRSEITSPTGTLTAGRRKSTTPVLTIERRTAVETAASREELIWHEIQNAARTRRILTGTLGGIERLENGNSVAVVYYKDLRIIIPISEMMLRLGAENLNYGTMAERENKILNNMLGCDIDFVIKGIDSKTRSAVASRREAMIRKRRLFYVDVEETTGTPRIFEGRIVQARVVAVATKVVRVEAFGVETSIMARDLSWEWIGDAHERYTVGDRILIRVNKIRMEDMEELTIQADARSMTENTVAENLKKCHVQGKYAGAVTDIHKGVIFIRLAIGVNAIAHSCLDRRMPAKQDSVSFVVTHIDDEQGVAMGLITRIIKQQI